MTPEQRAAAYYPNRDGTTWDGLRVDGPHVKVPRPRLVRHRDHVCPDGTRITGITAQHLAHAHRHLSGITLYRGHYPEPDEHGAYTPVHFPIRFGDHRHTSPDTTDLDHHHATIGRAAA